MRDDLVAEAVRLSMRRRNADAFRSWLLLGALAPLSCALAGEPAAVSGRAMGTTWSAKWVQPEPPLETGAVKAQIGGRLEELERVFSTYRVDSELSRFNRGRGSEWVAVSPELAAAAQRAREVSELTGGAFDVTVAPLLELWGLGPFRARDTAPTAAGIAAVQARVDWRQLEVRADPPALRKLSPDLAAEFSSLAKGLAVDEMSRWLAARGAANHLVRVGGDLRAAGAGPAGGGWRVAIEEPDEATTAIARVLSLSDQALSTSGQYRNFVTLGAWRYGHILDPRTGRPVESNLAAVSVLAASCATSSALATGLFVLGAEAGFACAEQKGLAAAFLIRRSGVIRQQSTRRFDEWTYAPNENLMFSSRDHNKCP